MTSMLKRVEVISIEDVEEYDVYDITVRGSHNFFAGGLNVHNSSDPK